jgi:hypothetical protein
MLIRQQASSAELAGLARRLSDVRAISLLIVGLLLASPAMAAEIRLVNDADLPEAQFAQLRKDFSAWAARVYRYNHVTDPLPATAVITRRAGFGAYVDDTIYIPPDSVGEMLETWVHELAHHATGHDSSFFLKEGIAVNTLEALFAEDHRIPDGWPQYGQRNDAWVSLFLQRGLLPPLQQLIDMDGYDGSGHEGDFRSWQAYIIGGSFVGWLIRNESYDAFREVFRNQKLGPKTAEWERRWLDSIRQQKLPPFDPKDYLPKSARYQYFVRRVNEAAP